VQAIAQATAALGVAAQQGQIAARLFQPAHLRATERIQRFVGEVDGRFHVDAQQHQLLDHGLDAAREHAVQRTSCSARGTVVAGGDQVGDGLGLGQVELAVEERPFAELTRPRLARSAMQRATSCCSSTGLPWPCSSTTSSPVKLFGAGNHSTMPSSMTSPSASRRRA
jgi:hypothetical protein